jgi:methylthioribose-1-phosphate isomerase
MVETIQWTDAGVVMIDQTRLPREQAFVTCRTYQEVAEAIRSMVIRGAPAIGVAAAMGVALGVQQNADFETVCTTLAETRPTAVNLFWAIDRMRRLKTSLTGATPDTLVRGMIEEAQRIRLEDIAICPRDRQPRRGSGAGR